MRASLIRQTEVRHGPGNVNHADEKGRPEGRPFHEFNQRSEGRLKTGLLTAQDQGVDVMGAFIGDHRLQFHHVADHVELQRDTVAAMHITGVTGDFQRLTAVSALDDRDHLRSGVSFANQSTNAQRGLEAQQNFGLHVGKLQLEQLGLRQGFAELLAVETVLTRGVPAAFVSTQGQTHLRPPLCGLFDHVLPTHGGRRIQTLRMFDFAVLTHRTANQGPNLRAAIILTLWCQAAVWFTTAEQRREDPDGPDA